MSDSVNVVCPRCNAVNRVPGARLAAGPKCGKCKSPILSGVPLDFKIGRQDLFLGNGWLVGDGTPLDGSRTFYFDAIRATLPLLPSPSMNPIAELDPLIENDYQFLAVY